ncbi:hypothetical protein [Pseudolysinimonas sp.]|uniref:hypothetical protein n=1 Tax=Pseudolysinimonas sp. TaxID=2680009 RepID=UPI003F7D8663
MSRTYTRTAHGETGGTPQRLGLTVEVTEYAAGEHRFCYQEADRHVHERYIREDRPGNTGAQRVTG